jgi:hypothetical protein
MLADISGYTSFVAQTEIEHADLALSYLLEVMVEKLSPVLTISQLEGDAVFAYLEENKIQEGETLLELIDQTYLAFRDKALALYSQATCPCRACQALPTLDLKFMLHHGGFQSSPGNGCQPDPQVGQESRIRIHGLDGICTSY